MQPNLSPYITFGGDCKDAMEFYKSCLGGKLHLQKYGDTPMPCPDDYKDKIMHAALENETLSLFACDTQPTKPVTVGDNIHLAVAGSDEQKLKEMFAKLSEGGTVNMELAPQFWGDTFGMLTDKFGIHWMFNISKKKAE